MLATGEVKCIDEEIPFDVPNGWKWCRLSALTTRFSTGPFGTMLHKEDYTDNGVAVINPTNIINHKISINNIKQISLAKAKELQGYAVCKGDIILARRGDLRKSAIITDFEDSCIAGTGSFIFHLLGIVNSFFILFYISPYVQDYLITDSIGTTMNNLNQKLLSRLLIPIPPRAEQVRIVSLVDELFSLVNTYDMMKNKLDFLNSSLHENIKKSILQEAIQGKLVPQIAEEGTAKELLELIKTEKQKLVKEGKLKKSALNDSVIFKGDDNKYYEQIGRKCLDITKQIPFEIPNSWTWARMGQVGDWGAGSTPQRGNQDYYGGNILWLKTGELNNDIVYDTEEKITQRAFQDCSLRMNKIGDVLIAMYGATIGKLAIVGKELTTNQACCGCTPYVVYNWFLFYFLMANRDSFIKKGEGGAQPNISRVKLVEHLIPLPPLNEQKRIVKRIETLFEQLH